jgi:hypothetical protein
LTPPALSKPYRFALISSQAKVWISPSPPGRKTLAPAEIFRPSATATWALKWATQTTLSARQITLSTQGQRQSTQEATTAVEQIASVAMDQAGSAQKTVEAADKFGSVAAELEEAVSKYQLKK